MARVHVSRREALIGAAILPFVASCSPSATPIAAGPLAVAKASRTLGKTGAAVEAVSLGGEGILRTRGHDDDAVATIVAALEAGVRYCDTAPAYDQSQDYYGAAFAKLPGARERVFLASKTHERTREGALKLLDDSLKRIGTTVLDLWQMHDLRTTAELDAIFAPGGAIEAAEEAKRAGRVRHIGLTGHFDPAILMTAMSRYAFDAVLVPINASDPGRKPFITTVVAEARRQNMGVIGMKVLARGRLIETGASSAKEAIRYAMAHCDTAIIGCASPDEIRANLAIARTETALEEPERRSLEARLSPESARYSFYKA